MSSPYAPSMSQTAEMLMNLNKHGIQPRRLTFKRSGEYTGCFIADWFVPELKEPVERAAVYADRLRAAGYTIVTKNETRAMWREGQPTIIAAVVFR